LIIQNCFFGICEYFHLNYWVARVQQGVVCLKRYGYLNANKSTLHMLIESEEIKLYHDTNIHQENEVNDISAFSLKLVNEKGEAFTVLNIPLDDGTCYEIDRIEIIGDSSDEDDNGYLMHIFIKPTFKFYREHYQIGSRLNKGEVDNVEADVCFTIEDHKLLLLIICSDGASLRVKRNNIDELKGLQEVEINSFLLS
jgi:hypothetical protein